MKLQQLQKHSIQPNSTHTLLLHSTPTCELHCDREIKADSWEHNWSPTKFEIRVCGESQGMTGLCSVLLRFVGSGQKARRLCLDKRFLKARLSSLSSKTESMLTHQLFVLPHSTFVPYIWPFCFGYHRKVLHEGCFHIKCHIIRPKEHHQTSHASKFGVLCDCSSRSILWVLSGSL